MKSAGEWTADVILLVLGTLYTCYAAGHISAMWKLRKEFFVALRSPLLACICGSCRFGRSGAIVYFQVFNGSETGGVVATITLITTPALWVGNGALISWMIRLLVLYDPKKRRRWGRYVNEKRVARALCWTYAAMEAALWVVAAVHGLSRAYRFGTMMEAMGIPLVFVASIGLAAPLRKVHDVEGLSRDARHLGVFLIATFVVTGVVFGTPGVPPIALKYWYGFAVTADAGLVSWKIIIKPMREFLRSIDGEKRHTLGSWLFWERRGVKGNASRVACSSSAGTMRTSTITRHKPRSRASSGIEENPLAIIMGFQPLKQAWGEYCQRALCGESFQFLVDASEFQASVHATNSVPPLSTMSTGKESNASPVAKSSYEQFIAIVNEYIKDNSDSEINISSRTKKQILGFEERSSYASLDVEGRSGVFLEAQKEIAKMLAENLLGKFKATAEYEEVAGDLLFEAN